MSLSEIGIVIHVRTDATVSEDTTDAPLVDGPNVIDPVLVTVDGIPFQSAARVKSGGTKVVQSGPLITGESIGS
jgi:hypothetical protein